jgi:hypothetical protein
VDPVSLVTYRHLRLAMLLLVFFLGTAVVLQIAAANCVQSSVSAYYFTAAGPAFVAALCGIGVCLMVYRGQTDPENVALDIAGFLAFVVALVPTTPDTDTCVRNDPVVALLTTGVSHNVTALFLSAFAAVIVTFLIERPRARSARVGYVIGVVLLGVGVFTARVFPDWFQGRAHTTAAVTLFGMIIFVVLINGWKSGVPPTFQRLYRLLAGLMVATLIGAGVAALLPVDFIHILFVIEAALITEFGAYWAIQTVQLYHVEPAERR